MNQILNTSKYNNKDKIKQKIFKIQFHGSIFITLIIFANIFFYSINLYEKEYISKSLIKNYNISRMYSFNTIGKNKQKSNNNTIFGIIEIPKLGIYYPIFSNLNEELLKISPCKFFGESPIRNGNICIAGHNYNNSMFFSNLDKLSINDKVFIFDNIGEKYVYNINKIYEVNDTDLSPIFDYEKDRKILTLITCNNNNLNRIIVRAKQE